jgi:hypothetical protein
MSGAFHPGDYQGSDRVPIGNRRELNVSPQEAIVNCRTAHERKAPRWPFPLLAYLDDPPDEVRVFDWTSRCVEGLLEHQERSTMELKDAIRLVRRRGVEGVDSRSIEEVAWGLWVRRSTEDTSLTAVAQLLFAHSRGDRSERRGFLASCATPIDLLERMETRTGEVRDWVIASFLDYIGEGTASSD